MANNAAIFTGMGMSQHTCGVDNVQNEINLALITGNLGKPGTGVNPLRGQNNVKGPATWVRCRTSSPATSPSTTTRPAGASRTCGVRGARRGGLTNVEISHEAGHSVKGLYVMGENPIMSEPDGNEVEERLKSLEFMVAQDIFMTETAEFADVVLPATTWAERGGTVTNTDRRVQRMRGAEMVHENTKHDLDILMEVGSRLFSEDEFRFDDVEAVFEELREVCPIYHGMTYDALGETGIQWPCYEEGDQGDQYLYEDSFDTESGRARTYRGRPPPATGGGARRGVPADPHHCAARRALQHGDDEPALADADATAPGELRRRAPERRRRVRDRGRRHGDAPVATRRIEVKAQVTEDIKEGVVWTTPHFAAASANRLTNDVLDERAKIPEYKAAAADIAVTVSDGGERVDDAEPDAGSEPGDDRSRPRTVFRCRERLQD